MDKGQGPAKQPTTNPTTCKGMVTTTTNYWTKMATKMAEFNKSLQKNEWSFDFNKHTWILT